MSYRQLIDDARARDVARPSGEVTSCSVVGAVDIRRRAATTTLGKAHGPQLVVGDSYRAAPAEMTRLLDPVSIEATTCGDVPVFWQGGDAALSVKNGLKDLQALDNQRVVSLADNDPKLVASELRERLCGHIAPNIVQSQWGDGFGPEAAKSRTSQRMLWR